MIFVFNDEEKNHTYKYINISALSFNMFSKYNSRVNHYEIQFAEGFFFSPSVSKKLILVLI